MAPAFPSTRRAAAFGGALVFFLTLPMTLHWIGGTTKEQAYRGISERAGAFDYIRRQIFEQTSDLDILFCGSSLLGAAVDVPFVERELSRALGRKASVVSVRQSWQGPDLNYYVARDLMEQRKAKLLVIAAPAWVHRSSQPHVQLFRVIRYGDHPGALDGLAVRSRLAIYADYVLGSPRHALSLLRPNLIDSQAGLTAGHVPPGGYRGRPFVRRQVVLPAIPPASLVYSSESRDLFRFDGPPLNAYQLHFLLKTAELARQHSALLVILHMPSPSERGSNIVPDRQLMPEMLRAGAVFAGVPSARMFENVPDAQFEDYFQDEHVNPNGSELFTGIVTPALIQLYEQYSQSR
ncbi:MAG: hypothetical protein LAQ69_02410 [Acidobacteriia bacterium]|nr:hypothetical protein [Terriglobia bacterium]